MTTFKPQTEAALAKAMGAKLVEIRKAQPAPPGTKELSQARVADSAKISRRTYGKWENGEELPSMRKLLYLANFLRLPLRELMP